MLDGRPNTVIEAGWTACTLLSLSIIETRYPSFSYGGRSEKKLDNLELGRPNEISERFCRRVF